MNRSTTLSPVLSNGLALSGITSAMRWPCDYVMLYTEVSKLPQSNTGVSPHVNNTSMQQVRTPTGCSLPAVHHMDHPHSKGACMALHTWLHAMQPWSSDGHIMPSMSTVQ